MLKMETVPDYLLNEDTGKLATILPSMDTSRGQVHVITPAGIGDFCWVWSKFWKLAETKDVSFWFPNSGDLNRVRPYCDLVGAKFGGYVDVDTKALLEFPGEFSEGDYSEGGVFYVHSNRHIEEGKPLHEKCPKGGMYHQTWHPWLPFKNPAPPLHMIGKEDSPPHTGVNAGIWKYADPIMRKPYIVVHMANETYCEGNWFARQWATLLQWIEQYAPVRLIGAKWDESFMEKVTKWYTPNLPPCIGQSFATALTTIANSSAIIGVDSGLTIMATYMGLPALRAYPRWLRLMPGTFEDTEILHPMNKWLFMDELMDDNYPDSVRNWLPKVELV